MTYLIGGKYFEPTGKGQPWQRLGKLIWSPQGLGDLPHAFPAALVLFLAGVTQVGD